MQSTIGIKEQQIKELREQKQKGGDKLDIPPFLQRTETKEQADARFKRLTAKRKLDNKGVTLAPPVSVQKAIAKGLADPKGEKNDAKALLASLDPNKTAGGDVAMANAAKKNKPLSPEMKKIAEEKAEKKRLKAKNKRDKAKAVASGETKKMLLVGKAALDAIKKPATEPPKGKAKGKNKTEIALGLLKRKNGATRKEITDATDWPSINLKPIADRHGLKLKKIGDRYTAV